MFLCENEEKIFFPRNFFLWKFSRKSFERINWLWDIQRCVILYEIIVTSNFETSAIFLHCLVFIVTRRDKSKTSRSTGISQERNARREKCEKSLMGRTKSDFPIPSNLFWKVKRAWKCNTIVLVSFVGFRKLMWQQVR